MIQTGPELGRMQCSDTREAAPHCDATRHDTPKHPLPLSPRFNGPNRAKTRQHAALQFAQVHSVARQDTLRHLPPPSIRTGGLNRSRPWRDAALQSAPVPLRSATRRDATGCIKASSPAARHSSKAQTSPTRCKTLHSSPRDSTPECVATRQDTPRQLPPPSTCSDGLDRSRPRRYAALQSA